MEVEEEKKERKHKLKEIRREGGRNEDSVLVGDTLRWKGAERERGRKSGGGNRKVRTRR